MLESQLPTLNKQDRDDFALLTEQESHTIEGQIIKMMLVEQIIRNRNKEKYDALEFQMKAEGLEGQELQDALDNDTRLQKLHFEHIPLGDGRINLVVSKGEGNDNDPDPSIYRVMIPAHIDTVLSPAKTALENKSAKHPNRLQGLGVYDEGSSVLNNIDLAVETYVPVGIKAYFVFTVDEEEDSKGARQLMEQWEVWPFIDSVLSSEIGPVLPLPDTSEQMRLFAARTGRAKFITKITVDPRFQGHGAQDDLPNAGDALSEWMNRIKSRFYDGYTDPMTNEREPASAKQHPLLGKEKLEIGPFEAKNTRSGYQPTDIAECIFAVKMVSPSTIDEYTKSLRRWTKGIAKRERWDAYGINISVTQDANEPSYTAYEMPSDHPLVLLASDAIKAISGLLPEIIGAPSVADECDYATDMLKRLHPPAHPQGDPSKHTSIQTFTGTDKGVITIPINGHHAHHPDEWVSQASILQVRAVFKYLLENEQGFLRLRKRN